MENQGPTKSGVSPAPDRRQDLAPAGVYADAKVELTPLKASGNFTYEKYKKLIEDFYQKHSFCAPLTILLKTILLTSVTIILLRMLMVEKIDNEDLLDPAHKLRYVIHGSIALSMCLYIFLILLKSFSHYHFVNRADHKN